MSQSPTERAGLHIANSHSGDGRIIHRFRQSWLNTADTCLERARLDLTSDDETSDAAAMGTAVHLGIEATVNALKDHGEALPYEQAEQIAQDEFSRLIELPTFRWVQLKEKACRLFIGRAMTIFYSRVLPRLKPAATELSFGPLILHEDDKRIIEVTGTIDYIDLVRGAMDWKTAGRRYEPWEKERWAIQPTVYLWALWKMGMLEGDGPWPFTYCIFIKGSNVDIQTLKVERHMGDFEWLKDKTMALAVLKEAELPVWPKSDNHALCSPKWCGAFADGRCKGAFYNVDVWPKPSEPSGQGPTLLDGSDIEIEDNGGSDGR